MDRKFDYTQKILLAVEFADAPRRLEGMPATYARFKRLSIPDVVRAFDDTQNLFVQMIAGRKFRNVLEQHMGYWEKRVPDGKQCFVHYAIGPQDIITAAFNRIKGGRQRLYIVGRLSRRAAMLGLSLQLSIRRHAGSLAPRRTFLPHRRFGFLVQLLPRAALSVRKDLRRLGAVPDVAARWTRREQSTGGLRRQGKPDRARRFRFRPGQSQPLHQPARIFQRRARSRQTYLHGRSGLHLVRHAAEESVERRTRAQRGRSTSTKKTLPPSGFGAKPARAPIRSAKTRTI